MKCLTSALVVLVVCFLFEANFFASAAIGHTQPNPLRKPGGCYEESTGHMKGGQEITVPGQCERATCSPDGSITFASCGVMVVEGPGCRLSGVDLSKPYPECCPEPICGSSK